MGKNDKSGDKSAAKGKTDEKDARGSKSKGATSSYVIESYRRITAMVSLWANGSTRMRNLGRNWRRGPREHSVRSTRRRRRRWPSSGTG
ncbi:hypothetical protein E4U44_004587 [Claviceps purpurea]|nr:hypothetical protein E4U44_004587 [Claviceps purpurea]